MKPNFALNLSPDGIGLLHRGAKGWHVVGEVALSEPELGERLQFLRQTAVELDKGGLSTKLVIPGSQILYTEVEAPGPSDAERMGQIRAALDGATPYEIDDLAFDWSGDGPTVKVAAVARETLDEAESFAAEHQFNPVSFVAMPENGAFDGEPFFGLTGISDTLLDGAETVDRDAAAIVVLGPVGKPAPSDAPVAEPDAEEDARLSGEEAPAPEADTTPDEVIPTPDEIAPQEAAPIPAFQTRRERKAEFDDDQPLKLEQAMARLALLPEKTESGAPQLGGARRAEPAAEPAPDPGAPTDAGSPGQTPSEIIQQAYSKRGTAKAPVQKVQPPANEAQAMTVYGARKKPAAPKKPRYLGLILTLILLAVLAAAALWSTFFAGDPLSAPQPPAEEQSALPPAPEDQAAAPSPILPAAPEAPATLSTPEGTALADDPDLAPGYEPEPLPEPGFSGDLAGLAPDLEAAELPEAPAPTPAPVEITQEQAERVYKRSGIWIKPPAPPRAPKADETDTLYIASIDPVIASHDAVALPPVSDRPDDLSLPALPSPAAAGASYALDGRGFVVPTEEGALNPDGILVFVGSPARRPPPRGNRVPQVEQATPDARLATLRPAARPADLVERVEKAQLGGRTRTQLAALRPAPRPAAPKELAEEADTTPTAQAVAASLVPSHRPSGFARIVESARSKAAESGTTQVAAVAAPQSVAPKIPTTASVARQATVKNAINLRRVNLIGVYGSPSTRRALVRLPSGRYVKVKVGDRMDGGKVAAIGENSLQYVKGGRNITLQMPKS